MQARAQLVGEAPEAVEQRQRFPASNEGLQPIALDDLGQRGVVPAALAPITGGGADPG